MRPCPETDGAASFCRFATRGAAFYIFAMTVLRPVIGLCLALMLALTSGAMAVARGQTMAAGTIVLCTGTGPLAVSVDADGQPVGPAHICPDCALSLLDAPAPAPADMALPGVWVAFLVPLTALQAVPRQVRERPQARAPPLV